MFSGIPVFDLPWRATSSPADFRPARWPAARNVIELCTRDEGRPDWISAEDFAQLVAASAAAWRRIATDVIPEYSGACDADAAADGHVEVEWSAPGRFWGDHSDGTTLLRTRPVPGAATDEIQWGKVRLHPATAAGDSAAPCVDALRGLVGHELGHLLGLTHTASRDDLMYAGPIEARWPSEWDEQALSALYAGQDER